MIKDLVRILVSIVPELLCIRHGLFHDLALLLLRLLHDRLGLLLRLHDDLVLVDKLRRVLLRLLDECCRFVVRTVEDLLTLLHDPLRLLQFQRQFAAQLVDEVDEIRLVDEALIHQRHAPRLDNKIFYGIQNIFYSHISARLLFKNIDMRKHLPSMSCIFKTPIYS